MKGARFSAAFRPSWKKLKAEGETRWVTTESKHRSSRKNKTSHAQAALANWEPALWLDGWMVNSGNSSARTKNEPKTLDFKAFKENRKRKKEKSIFEVFSTTQKKKKLPQVILVGLTWAVLGNTWWGSAEDQGPDAPSAPGSSRDTENTNTQKVYRMCQEKRGEGGRRSHEKLLAMGEKKQKKPGVKQRRRTDVGN